MKNLNIPINKGNYTLEKPDREELFQKYLSEGWEEKYKEYRQNWIKFAKEKFISEYPLLVDAELSTVCNLKCPMCYTITEEYKKNITAEFMDFNLFKKIIDEIACKVPALRLSLRGEPTLHPKFIDCVKYAKDKGIGEISTLTNASKLTDEYFEKIMLAGIDWITVSVDGVGENYESVRKPLKFADTFQKIKNIKAIKEKYNRKKPVIKVQGVWPAIRQNPGEFYNTFEPYVDNVAFNPLIDYLGKDEDIVYDEDFSCPQHYQRMVIGVDGLVMMCSNDQKGLEIIGDTNVQTIHEIWHGESLNKMRELHKAKNGFKQIPVCKNCYLPRLTEDGEIAEVNGRKLIIKNYVNRKQEIGK
jgi:MoaA/NifB/PqqE/SkfB family radical SAM enzyme